MLVRQRQLQVVFRHQVYHLLVLHGGSLFLHSNKDLLSNDEFKWTFSPSHARVCRVISLLETGGLATGGKLEANADGEREAARYR